MDDENRNAIVAQMVDGDVASDVSQPSQSKIESDKFEHYARLRLGRLMAGLGRRESTENPTPANEPTEKNFVRQMRSLVANMPVSHGGRYYCRFNVRIGIVCDEFLWDSWKDAADFVYISPDQAPDIALKGLDCFVVASAWHGLKNNEWEGMYHLGSPTNAKIHELISAAKRLGIHVVFYSKEDPPNYEFFVEIAKKADTIFTSAEEMVSRYKEDCGTEDVSSLNFCVNPICHNPIGIRFAQKLKDVVFSGSWMVKYPKRCEDLAMMLDGVLLSSRKLAIIDRNYKLRANWRYAYPSDYQAYVNPAVDHALLQKIHKLYDWALNINSVQESRTMFANRVYELQASGNLLISDYSLGMVKTFPTVFLATSRSSVKSILASFSDEEVYERQVAGVRRVMTGETCYDRIAQLLNVIGIQVSPIVRKVLVIANAVDERTKSQFARQTCPAKRLVEESKVTEEDYNWADIIAFFDSSCDYGAFYLEDMVNAFKYVDCNYITKAAFVESGKLVEGPEHTYVSRIGSKFRTVFWRSSYGLKELLEMSGPRDLPGGYAIDHFNFARDSSCRKMPEQWRPKLSVIVPLHNNGWALYGRLFPSLKRTPLFKDMEVVVVNAGSDDDRSPKIAAQLAETYANVRLVESKGKAGDLDAARDLGVVQSSAPYVMFADPEVEVDAQGVLICFREINSGFGFEMVIGNSEENGMFSEIKDNYGLIFSAVGKYVIANGAEMCSKVGDSIRDRANVVYRRAFLLKNKIIHCCDTAFVGKAMNASKSLEIVPVVISKSVWDVSARSDGEAWRKKSEVAEDAADSAKVEADLVAGNPIPKKNVTTSSLPEETWDRQREYEKKYFTK